VAQLVISNKAKKPTPTNILLENTNPFIAEPLLFPISNMKTKNLHHKEKRNGVLLRVPYHPLD